MTNRNGTLNFKNLRVAALAALSLAVAVAFGDDGRWYDLEQRVNWGYTVSNGEATISTPNFWDQNARAACKGDIVVPARIGPDGPNGKVTYPVRDMVPGLFRHCRNVTSVTLPDGIRRIASQAFFCTIDPTGHSTLTNVVVGAGCLDICDEAFEGCRELVSVNIPNTVTNIGHDVFSMCYALPRIDIPGSVKKIGDSAFASCLALAEATIGDGVEIIGGKAFMSCSSLLAIDVPSSVRTIEGSAFSGCRSMASAILHEGLTEIGDGAFYSCEALVQVNIPASVTRLGRRAFYQCPDGSIGRITGFRVLDGWVLERTDKSIGYEGVVDFSAMSGLADGAFLTVNGKADYSIRTVTLPAGMTRIGDGMFGGCAALGSIQIPPGVREIGSGAFAECASLGQISLPAGVTNIADGAFSNCSGLTDINLPSGLALMGDRAFHGCASLPDVTIPASLKRIPMNAFEYCTGLTNVVVEEGVEVIGNASFLGCTGLSSFRIPDSVKIVESIAFWGCDRLLDTNTVANVDMVDGWIVDSNQPKLTEVTVPGDVRGISECAFSYRSSLTNVVVEEGVTSIPFQAFACDAKLTDVSLPSSLVEIGKQAFISCNALVSIYVPGNVVAIGEEAFGSCSALETVYLPISLRGKVDEGDLVKGSFNAKIRYYRADGSIDDLRRVTFDPNGGELAETDAVRDVKEGAAVGALPVPVRPKYRFLGWFTDRLGDGEISATTKVEDNVTFYAQWVEDPDWFIVDIDESYETNSDGSFELGLGSLVQSASVPKFSVKGLPSGLKYDAKALAISGVATKPGVYTVTVGVTVKKTVTATFELVVPNLTDGEIPVADEYGPFIPGVAYTNTVGAAADCAVTGLPSGMKWTAKDILDSKTKTVAIPANSFYGAATKPGSYTVYFTKTLKETNAAGKTVSVKHTATATFTVGPFPVVAVEIGGTGTGKVTGAGAFAANKKVTLKATADTKDAAATATKPATVKSVFMGWYDGETLLSQAASYSLVMPEEDVSLTAWFVTAAEDAASIAAAVNGVEMAAAVSSKPPYQTNVWAGVYMEWPVEASALSLPTVKVAGLPSGLKFTAKDIVDSKTKQVTVPANTIYGVPTAASKVNAKTGEVTPSAVKVTVTTAGKSSQTYQVNVAVDALPTWAVGTFDGGGDNGQATLTVSAAGKISGKLLSNGLTWALSAASFTDVESPLSDVESPSFLATVIGKSGKMAITNALAITSEALGADGARGVGVLTGDVSVAVYQNLWKTEPWKIVGKSVANKTFTYKVEDADGNPGELTLKLAANGTVTAKGVFTTGVNEKTGKPIVYTASGTAVLVPTTAPDETGAFAGVAWVYFPPRGDFAGYIDCIVVGDGE